jgi:O-antigen/teichoic acid export membrane protein
VVLAAPSLIRHLFLPPATDFFLVRFSGLMVLLTGQQLLFFAQVVVNQQGKPYSKLMVGLTIAEIAMLSLAAWGFGIHGVYAAMAASLIVQLWGAGRIIFTQTPFTRIRWRHLPVILGFYRYGVFVYLSGLAAWVIDASDRIILGKFVPLKELGIYQVSYGLAGHLQDLAVPVYVVLIPLVSGAVASGKSEEGVDYFLKSQRFLILAYGLLVPLISWLGKDILLLLTTPDFVAGARYLPWVASGIACFQIFGIYNYNLHAHQKGQLILIPTAAAAAVNVGLNLWLIPRYGAIAAAWSTFLAYVVNFVIVALISQRFMKIPFQYRLWAKVAGAIALMSLFLWISQQIFHANLMRLAVGGCLGAAIYGGSLWISGGLNREDLAYLGQVFKSFRQEPG